MSKKSDPYKKGDWIVHTFYGVGQITGIEKKIMGEETQRYYKVLTKNSTYFIPTDNVDNSRLRPVSSTHMLRKACNAIKGESFELPSDHTQRKRLISEKINEGTLVSTAELIRDLYTRRMIQKLNDHDENTLNKLISNVVKEWSITKDIREEVAQEKFDTLIKKTFSPKLL